MPKHGLELDFAITPGTRINNYSIRPQYFGIMQGARETNKRAIQKSDKRRRLCKRSINIYSIFLNF